MSKHRTPEQIFADIAKIANILPASIYWLDTKGVVLGANNVTFKLVGGQNDIIVGKEHHHFYPKDVADTLTENNRKVIQLGETVEFEETIVDITTGKSKYLTSIRSPLCDDDGKIIGVIGTSIDITAKKEAELLKSKILQEQQRFKKIVDQVSHDIRSPIASLLTFAKCSKNLPEDERIALREAANRLNDIANNLLVHYNPTNDAATITTHERQPLLVSAAIMQILSEKRLQYSELPIKFNHNFSQIGHFAFIYAEASSFKRMLSNLLNNAADALQGEHGMVTIDLKCDNGQVQITIQDNGRGISEDNINKILQGIAFTEGKEDGYGIGLTQIRETLQRNQGNFAIDSKLGYGTTITLSFPKIVTPNWIADKINISNDDIIVILDDDPSIHSAWNTRFKALATQLSLYHFEEGRQAIEFITSKTEVEKQNIFLLTDYELLGQQVNGLDVIQQTQIKRSILVTSHYANNDIRESITKANTKLLPKQLASEVPIEILVSSTPNNKSINESKQVDLVFIDDNENLLNCFKQVMFEDKVVDTYLNPHDFLSKVDKYPKNTKICIDSTFETAPEISGLELAHKLHEAGFTKLYLISGAVFHDKPVPPYLTYIPKTDIDKIKLLASQ